jgi:SAM-dependent methyltransferase
MTDSRQAYSRTAVYMADAPARPKHMFVRIADLLEERLRPPRRLLDVGSASGAFAAYALQRFAQVQVTGVDFDGRLVEEARRRVPGARFEVGDANRLGGIADGTFDAVTLTGTHSIFDDFRPSFRECIRACAPGGRVVVTGIFNPFPVDAHIHWRYAGEFQAPWHPGYNLFSHASVAAFLRDQPRVGAHAFLPFRLPFDLPPQDDPIRSWTEAPGPDGERGLRNGIMPLPFEMLVLDLHG